MVDVNFNRLKGAISEFKNKKILVIGDLMLDRFIWGKVSRISPEAPVPVVEVEREDFLLGGAANVAHNLRALGARVLMAGVVGDDDSAVKFLELAASSGLDSSLVIKDERPTTVKTRVIAQGQQVVRVDRESRDILPKQTENRLCRLLEEHLDSIDGVVVSDYAKGVISKGLMNKVRELFVENGIPVLVDPKPINKKIYKGVSLVAPNNSEAQAISGIVISDNSSLEKALEKIYEELRLEAVLITRGSKGMALWQPDRGLLSIPTMAKEVYDVTGAGDTVMATLVLSKTSGLSWDESAYLANAAAGIVVGKVGTATVTTKDLIELLGI